MYFWTDNRIALTRIVTKILLLLQLIWLFWACNAVKRVPEGKYLLAKNEIRVNDRLVKTEEINQLPSQQPNAKFLRIPFGLHIFNLARPNNDSLFRAKYIEDTIRFKRMSKLLSEKQVYRLGESFWYKGFPNFLRSTGEAPVIIDTNQVNRSLQRLQMYYFNKGYFRVSGNYLVQPTKTKRANVTYQLQLGTAHQLDSITENISSPAIDSLYRLYQRNRKITSGQIYDVKNFEEERQRLNGVFRNNGVYNFQSNYITFKVDTVDTNQKAHIQVNISDFQQRTNDTTYQKPFQVHRFNRINVFTDTNRATDTGIQVDSSNTQGIRLISLGKLRYKPKAITNNIFLYKDQWFSDEKVSQTSQALNNLRVFNFPSIQVIEDPNDENRGLIANIYLRPREKFSFNTSIDFTHSNIQDFGILGNASLTIRNIFRGAETLQFGIRGNLGASKDLSGSNDQFFNVIEYGLDTKLTFPRLLFPVNTDRWIPKYMLPSTVTNLGFSKQQNIGLDKENFTGFFTYNWTPKQNRNVRFDFINLQYVNNLNIGNYFNIYRSSYNQLNQIANNYTINPDFLDDNNNLIIESGTNGFIQEVINGAIPLSNEDNKIVRSVEERRKRLTENNLILATSFTYTKSTKEGITDNSFSIFKTKIETAGNLLNLFAKWSNAPINEDGNRTFFNVAYSQYIKTELELIKHWDLKRLNVIAVRSFIGIAIPFGNSQNIPFTRSYFAGGSNDNRAWRPYSLGPGSSGGVNDFNEANLKIALNAEYRFKLFGNFRGALFVDAGNIWNALDNETIEAATFTGLQSLQDLAVGSGFGLRYDTGLFVVRIDTGFKTYNPALPLGNRWFKEYNFQNAVINLGINYPF
jgi:outer membrane protein assembly factor BamA